MYCIVVFFGFSMTDGETEADEGRGREAYTVYLTKLITELVAG